MGRQKDNYAEKMAGLLQARFTEKVKNISADPVNALVIQSVYWAKVFEDGEEKLFENLVEEKNLKFKGLRRFVIHYMADAIAYQPVDSNEQNYQLVNEKFQDSLKILANKAGNDAPLCVISHSLGSVIASNFFYDLQTNRKNVRASLEELSPLEKGDTLALFYTIGTTLPLWSLRYKNFDRPLNIPSMKLQDLYPGLYGEWINFYDTHDMLGFPLKNLSKEYDKAVNEDREISAGSILVNWNPLSHTAYLTDKDVINPIVDGLVTVWKQINGIKN